MCIILCVLFICVGVYMCVCCLCFLCFYEFMFLNWGRRKDVIVIIYYIKSNFFPT